MGGAFGAAVAGWGVRASELCKPGVAACDACCCCLATSAAMTAAACGVNVDDGGGEGPIAGAAGAVPVAPPAKACSSATAWGLGGAAAGACVPAAFWARAAKTADCEVAAPPVPVAPAASCARIAAACGLGAGAGGGVVATTGPGTAAVGIGAVGSAGGAAGGKATGAAPWAGSPGGAPTASPPNGCLRGRKKHDLKWMIVMVVLMFRQKVVSTFNQVCRIHTKKRGCTRHSRWGLSCGSNGSCDGCKLRRPYLTLNKDVNDG